MHARRVPAAALRRRAADPLRTNPFRHETRRCTMRFPMTTPELCELAGLTRPELQRWIDAGLLETDRDGRCREFADDDLERARLIKALHAKGLPLSRLPRENLAFDGRFIVFDGRNLLPTRMPPQPLPRPGGLNAAVCSICLRSLGAP